MNHHYESTQMFQAATGLTYARVHTALNNGLKQQGFEVNSLDWGKPLTTLLQNNETNMFGFFAICFPDVHSQELALLTDVIIMGDGDCPVCGGVKEHEETIIEGRDKIEVKVRCNICGAESYEWIEKDQSYYE